MSEYKRLEIQGYAPNKFEPLPGEKPVIFTSPVGDWGCVCYAAVWGTRALSPSLSFRFGHEYLYLYQNWKRIPKMMKRGLRPDGFLQWRFTIKKGQSVDLARVSREVEELGYKLVAVSAYGGGDLLRSGVKAEFTAPARTLIVVTSKYPRFVEIERGSCEDGVLLPTPDWALCSNEALEDACVDGSWRYGSESLPGPRRAMLRSTCLAPK